MLTDRHAGVEHTVVKCARQVHHDVRVDHSARADLRAGSNDASGPMLTSPIIMVGSTTAVGWAPAAGRWSRGKTREPGEAQIGCADRRMK
jgi:hypothetical protein